MQMEWTLVMIICRHFIKEKEIKMKNVKNIFAKIFMVSVMLMAVVMPTFADNGCEDDNNDAISAEFALCSTHVYNIGNIKNPDATERDLMNDVVAMKAELVTQQMYRHYEQMESMLRRFKTQLEKAVLTSNLQAAGASKNSDDSGSSFKQTDRNVYLAGVSNCLTEMDSIKQIECLNSNYTTIYNLSQNGAKVTTELRKQLANDFKTLYDNSINKKSLKETAGTDTNKIECMKPKELGNRKNFQDCLDTHKANINVEYNRLNQENRKYVNPWATQ